MSVWGYAAYNDAEQWIGAYATREEAIRAAEEDEDLFGCDIWIHEGQWPNAGALLAADLNVEDWLERVEENNELSFDDRTFEAKPGAEEALGATIKTWAEQYVSVLRWQCVGDPIHIRQMGDPHDGDL